MIAIRSAIVNNNPELLELHLSQTPEFRDQALHYAVKLANPSKEILTKLVNLGADVNSLDVNGETQGRTALFTAVALEKIEIVKLLLDNGAQVHSTGENLLSILPLTYDKSFLQILQLLVDHGADVNEPCVDDSETPLSIAAMEGYVEIVEFFLDRGAFISVIPLFYAVSNGHLRTVQLMLDRGFDVNAVCVKTMLSCAVSRGDLPMAKLLMDRGADVDDPSDCGKYPLHYALDLEHPEMLKLLLDRGADVNVTYDGKTPLENAVSSGNNVEFGKLLVRKVVWIKSLDLQVSEENLKACELNDVIWNYCCECEAEIDALKCVEFEDSDLRYFDVFALEDVDKLAALTRNDNIVGVIKSNDFVEKFPIYGQIVVKNFNRGVLRNNDLQLIKRFFNYLAARKVDRLPKLPLTFVGELFACLNSNDITKLRNL